MPCGDGRALGRTVVGTVYRDCARVCKGGYDVVVIILTTALLMMMCFCILLVVCTVSTVRYLI